MESAANKAVAVNRHGRRTVRIGWGLAALAAVAVVTTAVVGISVTSSTEQNTPVDVPKTIRSIYSADELAVLRLVAKGYIPAEILDANPYLTKRLINQGLVPRETLESLINRGLLPPQTPTLSSRGEKLPSRY